MTDSARRSSAEPILSPAEEWLVRFLNAPFMLVVPILLSAIAFMTYVAWQNTHPPIPHS